MSTRLQELGNESDEAQKEYNFWLRMEVLSGEGSINNELALKLFTARENVGRAFNAYHNAANPKRMKLL